MRASEVTLDFRDKRTKKRFPKKVNVVLAREDGTTPVGEKSLEWLLLTNRPITTVEELTQVVLGYAQRWRIEEFHRTWKSGACNRLLNSDSEAAKCTESFPELELMAVAFIACLSVSDPLILR